MRMASTGAGSGIDLDDLLTPSGLQSALETDRDYCDAEDLKVMWYHGSMSRDCAEKLLFKAMENAPDKNLDGMFLVRDASRSDKDFSLSFIFQERCYHFYIHCYEDDFFYITEGPKVHGLDKLIEHYIEAANHLPTRLTNLCMGTLPPTKVRRQGPTNLLHTAVANGRQDIVSRIIEHRLCPDINAKNIEGNTALHLAASQSQTETVAFLLSRGGDTNIRDSDGGTPLFKACLSNCTKVVQQLVDHDPLCTHSKNPVSGWLPMHAAAMFGHNSCAKILLEAGAARLPRDLKLETPLDVAEKYRRNRCQVFLENYQEELKVKWAESDWFYPDLDRVGVEKVFNESQKIKGMFLVRNSKRTEGHKVLSVSDGTSLFHYPIQTMEYRGTTVYFMDEGPLHRSLPLLLQFYHQFQDGLVTCLTMPVSYAETDLDPPGQAYEYSTCSSSGKATKPAALSCVSPAQYKPKLPPRPPDLDSPPQSPISTQATSPYPSPTEELTENQEDGEEPLMKIPRKDLKLGAEIGKGEYGSVIKGTYVLKRKLFGKAETMEVAIKQFHPVGDPEDFLQEAKVMQQLRNDYIVELKGVCYDKCTMLVEEFLPMGSMLDFLEECPEKVRPRQELYLWAAQIARGMMYLESKRLVHRDLAARNILLASLQKVKISDFGLSRAMGTDKEYYKASKGGRWPIKWYAPESVNFGHFSPASDVWSYGITLWEMFSYGSAPYGDKTGVEVIKFIEDGSRLEQPTRCPDMVYNTMLQCWSQEPSRRPTFSRLDKHFGTEDEYMSTRELMQVAGRL